MNTTKAYRGRRYVAPLHPSLGSRWCWVWLPKCPNRFAPE